MIRCAGALGEMPDFIASSTEYWINGFFTNGSISLGCDRVTGKKLVPQLAVTVFYEKVDAIFGLAVVNPTNIFMVQLLNFLGLLQIPESFSISSKVIKNFFSVCYKFSNLFLELCILYITTTIAIGLLASIMDTFEFGVSLYLNMITLRKASPLSKDAMASLICSRG